MTNVDITQREQLSFKVVTKHKSERLLALCPRTNMMRLTHATMSWEELAHYRGGITYWCSACQEAHTAARADLRWPLTVAGDTGVSR